MESLRYYQYLLLLHRRYRTHEIDVKPDRMKENLLLPVLTTKVAEDVKLIELTSVMIVRVATKGS